MDNRDTKRIQSFFDERADRFDALYDHGSGPLNRAFNRIFRKGLYERLRLTQEWMGDLEGKSILDLGCGSGRLSIAAAGAGAAKVVGVDISEKMIQLAKRRAAEAGLESVCEFHLIDFYRYSPPGKFDYSVALGVFDYVEDPVPLIRKMVESSRIGAIASYPGTSPLRGNFRRLRYFLRNCPLYLSSEASIRTAYREAGVVNPRISRYPSAGFLVMAGPA